MNKSEENSKSYAVKRRALLPFKVQQLLDVIIDNRKLGVEDAVDYLYSSQLYRKLSNESYLWQLSNANLYDLLKSEKRRHRLEQNNSSPILLFIAFCIENYKDHKHIESEEVLHLFKKYGVINYLIRVYDALHTQGRDYIMEDIDLYIKNRR